MNRESCRKSLSDTKSLTLRFRKIARLLGWHLSSMGLTLRNHFSADYTAHRLPKLFFITMEFKTEM